MAAGTSREACIFARTLDKCMSGSEESQQPGLAGGFTDLSQVMAGIGAKAQCF